jgi:hypothetical protein
MPGQHLAHVHADGADREDDRETDAPRDGREPGQCVVATCHGDVPALGWAEPSYACHGLRVRTHPDTYMKDAPLRIRIL